MRGPMKRIRSLAAAALCAACAALLVGAAAAPSYVGTVEYMVGEATLTRGDAVRDVELGDRIENFDLIKTSSDGRVDIKLAPGTGMSGSITVKPKTAFTVRTEVVKGSGATEAETMAGAVSVKVKKVAGAPTLRVRTGNTVMGVRGTEFEVATSVNDSLLVSCSEGRVACFDEDGNEEEAFPGQAVRRAAGEGLVRVPVAVSSLEEFRESWIAEELSVFSAAPVRALGQYASAYDRNAAAFAKAFAALDADPALAAWRKAARAGTPPPRSNDVKNMAEKSRVAPKLMAVRRVLFLFERVYYRLDEVRSLVPASAAGQALPNGETVSAFLARVGRELPALERRTAAYRQALRLFAERNDGGVPVGPAEDDGESFFGSDDGFFD